jgi:ATP-binding cassette subfamily B protein
MWKLMKYLKPYVLLIVLAIGLLFVQANADLALPDYMSRIVNVGIQQGGVENAVPSAVRAVKMDRLLMFLSEEEQAEVLAAYTLVDEESGEYATRLEEYPALAEGRSTCGGSSRRRRWNG